MQVWGIRGRRGSLCWTPETRHGSAGSVACSNSLATRAWPCMTALSKGVSPQLSTVFDTAPWANNSDAICSWPNYAARCSGILRRALITSGSAPCSSSRSTTRACPCRAAWCRAVSVHPVGIRTVRKQARNGKCVPVPCRCVQGREGGTRRCGGCRNIRRYRLAGPIPSPALDGVVGP